MSLILVERRQKQEDPCVRGQPDLFSEFQDRELHRDFISKEKKNFLIKEVPLKR